MIRWSLRSLWLALLLVLMLTLPATAQDKTLYWDRFDVDLYVNKDGSFDVVETQKIDFTSGVFTFGYRSIDTRLVDAITDIRVEDESGAYVQSNSQEPGTFTVSEQGDRVEIRWYFDEAADETRTFTISYRVEGGLRYYEGGDQVWWQAIYPERSFPVNNSVVTVNLPPPAAMQNLDYYFTPAEVEVVNPQTIRFTAAERIPPNQAFEVRVEFTPGVVAGAPASWQAAEDVRAAELEAQAEYDRTTRPWVNLIVAGVSLMLLVLAPLGLYLLWYTRGRDVRTDFVAEYLPEPPSDLPPGVVGALLDEQADMQDILATLLDLARRGYISMEELEPEKSFFGLGGESDFKYELLKQPDDALRPYETQLLNALFGKKSERKLSDLKAKFYKHLPKLKTALYDEVTKQGLFTENPERVRNRWALFGVLALVAAVALSCVLVGALASYSDFALALPCGIGAFAIGLIVLARFMPRKSSSGSEQAARWRAFRAYLQQIEKYTNLERATELFERYLPYAVAFNLERDFIRKWSQVPATPIPPWYMPYPRPMYDHGPMPSSGGGKWIAGEASPAPRMPESKGMGGLGDASRGMSTGLAGMSAGLSTMLSSAASTLSSRPAPPASSGGWTSSGGHGSGGWSGGGWSGGGSFGGGGGGGGGGGFG